MPIIQSVTVSGLAGNSADVHIDFHPKVTCIFGKNGCGKTTLLSILRSALKHDSALLEGLAFEEAEVKLYSFDHDREFTYSYKSSWLRPDDTLFGSTSTSRQLQRIGGRRRFVPWKVEPEVELGFDFWRHGYLDAHRFSGNRVDTDYSGRHPVREHSNRFADLLKSTWLAYSSDKLSQSKAVQEEGLSRILQFVLAGEESGMSEIKYTEVEGQIRAFLSRQGLPHDIIDKCVYGMATRFSDPVLQQVVGSIIDIEDQIQYIDQRGSSLQKLINRMFTGRKRVSFTEDDLVVETSAGEQIELSALSSGEQQLLMLLMMAVRVSGGPLVIDEPELSLHLEWQRELVDSIYELSPELQLIMATHAPEVLANVPDDQVCEILTP